MAVFFFWRAAVFSSGFSLSHSFSLKVKAPGMRRCRVEPATNCLRVSKLTARRARTDSHVVSRRSYCLNYTVWISSVVQPLIWPICLIGLCMDVNLYGCVRRRFIIVIVVVVVVVLCASFPRLYIFVHHFVCTPEEPVSPARVYSCTSA